MMPDERQYRRRGAGAFVAVCGGGAAAVAGLSGHVGGGAGSAVWRDAGIAVAVALIVVAFIGLVAGACRDAAKRRP